MEPVQVLDLFVILGSTAILGIFIYVIFFFKKEDKESHEFCPRANAADPNGPYASTVHPPLTTEQTIETLRAAIVQLEKQIAHLQEDKPNV